MTVSVIILSYNTKLLLKQCLTSLRDRLDFTTGKLEIIVVDNASRDGSVALVKQNFPQVKIISLPQNLGFAAGNNRGLAVATGDYVLLLNSDTQITDPQLITVLLRYLQAHPKVALVTPKVLLPDGSLDLACHRGLPTPWNALTYFSGLAKVLPKCRLLAGYHQTYQNLNVIHPIAATAATAVLVRRQAIDAVGQLDERFFLYGEDLDWCKRLTDAGWQIVYHPQVSILHHKSASGKRQADDQDTQRQSVAHFYLTMKLFYEKHYRDTYPRWLRRLVYLGIDLKQRWHR
ncbi:hypothetical protein A2W24_05765 [Microgenomates group bacterium RBG_16_45_19]|nr:MAG: hypothetical protein A2W24_05765 [Microgenomates group bacterium RBG_16_45_19]